MKMRFCLITRLTFTMVTFQSHSLVFSKWILTTISKVISPLSLSTTNKRKNISKRCQWMTIINIYQAELRRTQSNRSRERLSWWRKKLISLSSTKITSPKYLKAIYPTSCIKRLRKRSRSARYSCRIGIWFCPKYTYATLSLLRGRLALS